VDKFETRILNQTKKELVKYEKEKKVEYLNGIGKVIDRVIEFKDFNHFLNERIVNILLF
jgi:hypothetical protein